MDGLTQGGRGAAEDEVCDDGSSMPFMGTLLTSSSQIKQSQPCQLCVASAIAQSGCLIRTDVILGEARLRHEMSG
jgi:hypothetical protein